MATPTCSNDISHHSPEESSLKIYDDNEVKNVKDDDQTKKSSAASSEEEAALQVVPVLPPTTTESGNASTFVGKLGGVDVAGDESGRERLKRHRTEMGGQVWIPDTWGQENLLKNWIDCTSFDASLVNNTILSARAALIQQRTATTRKPNHLSLHRRIENRC